MIEMPVFWCGNWRTDPYYQGFMVDEKASRNGRDQISRVHEIMENLSILP